NSPISWATRWDNYLNIFDPNIHWFSLVNSVVIVLFLTGMVAMILLRALHKDISRYNAVEAQEDVQEDFGWKLVHGDVFRPPAHGMLLSVLLGNGAQLFFMTAVTLVFAVLGFLSPSNRGSLATVMIIFYMVFGSIAGYISARVYKMFGGESWKYNIFLTAFLFPGIIFGCLVLLNFFLIGVQSSGAVPFGTMLAIVGLWFLVSVPLSFVGSYFGFKKAGASWIDCSPICTFLLPSYGSQRLDQPVRTNQIPRQIPDQVFYLRSLPSILMGGVLPFGAIFIELYFIMNSIWFHRIYYVFGTFPFRVFVLASPTGFNALWLPLSCLRHPDSDVLGGDDLDVLLPPVRRGLPLVVACFPYVGGLGPLRHALLGALLRDQAADRLVHELRTVLWLELHNVLDVLCSDG
ncbi:Endomembrane protein 70-domain-containing protein, partial [Jimgerdemannia flammicorona]